MASEAWLMLSNTVDPRVSTQLCREEIEFNAVEISSAIVITLNLAEAEKSLSENQSLFKSEFKENEYPVT
jgi:hypothetical protein